LRLWTLKEAYLKALGHGLSVSLATIEFDMLSLERSAPRLLIRAINDGHVWYFQEFMPTREQTAAIALQADGDQEPVIDIRNVDADTLKGLIG
jgi:4'-phosphopantetheinyl transferase